jgi:hypothetical protein
VKGSDRHIIESGGIGGGDEQRALYVLGGLSYCRVLPAGDLELIGNSHRPVTHRLVQAQGQPRRRVGHILAKHQDRISLLCLVYRELLVLGL